MSWRLVVQMNGDTTAGGNDDGRANTSAAFHGVFALRALTTGARRKIVALDGAGRACRRGLLLEDGQHLPSQSVLASSYETAQGRSFSRSEAMACDDSGEVLATLAPTRDRPQTLERVAPEVLLDYVTDAVYHAVAEQVSPALMEALRAGQVFKTSFRPQATLHEHPAFVLSTREGAMYLLLCEALQFVPCKREKPLPPEDEDWEDEWGDPWAPLVWGEGAELEDVCLDLDLREEVI